jgi:nucleoside-diphosphate-sugar epimerase
MRILLTGGTGFVGKYLLEELLRNNFDVALLVRQSSNIIENKSLKYVFLYDKNWKIHVKEFNADVVIHLASYLTSLDDESSLDNLLVSNILFGTHLLDAIKETKLKLFINTGTFAEYEKENLSPAYLYAATKTAFRSIIKYYQNKYKFKSVNVIPYTIYGGKDKKKKLIDLIYDSAKTKEPVNMSPGEQILDFIHIDDVVRFYIGLLGNYEKLEKDDYVVHLGTGVGTSPKQIALLMDRNNVKTNVNWGGISYRPTDTMYSVAPKSELFPLILYNTTISINDGIILYINTINKLNGV